MSYILAIDLGSTQMKIMVLNEKADIVFSVTEKYETVARQDGWLEQNPSDWEKALVAGIKRLKKEIDFKLVQVISFSGHMSGVVLVDADGNALYPCIMLSDVRSQKQCDFLNKEVGALIKEKTGNAVNNAFSLPKLCWLKEEEPSCYRKAKTWLSPKDYVRYCLTGSMETEYTDAYNSLCVNKETMDWDEQIITGSGLDMEKFPPMCSPFDIVGQVTPKAEEKFGINAGISVVSGAADMACAVLGTGLKKNGDAALTLGTCATFFTVVPKPESEWCNAVTFHPTVSGEKMYALGSHMNGGAAVNWISTILSEKGKIDYSMIAELSKEAMEVPAGSNGVMTIPFLVGSGSPYFCSADRQHVIGMQINTTRGEVFRSQLEGISYNLYQTLDIFKKITKIEKMMLAGGGIQVAVWTNIITDVFGLPVELFDNPDVSTLGAGLIGASAIGVLKKPEQIAIEKRKIIETKIPEQKNVEQYKMLYNKYLEYYEVVHRLDVKEQNE